MVRVRARVRVVKGVFDVSGKGEEAGHRGMYSGGRVSGPGSRYHD